MLTLVRSLLDESSAGFYTDTEIYSALRDGQKEVINMALSIYQTKRSIDPKVDLPQVLVPLITIVVNLAFGTTGTTTVALPADFLYDLHVEYDDNSNAPIPAFRRGESPTKYFDRNNTYLVSTQAQYFYHIDGTNLNFETAVSGVGAYRLTYLKKPPDIYTTVEPLIPDFAHAAVVKYAFAFLLMKDEKIAEGQSLFNEFMQQALRLTEI